MARSLSLPKLNERARTQLGLFLGAYLVYTAGRWLTVSDLAPATEYVVDIAAGLAVTAAGYGVSVLIRPRRELAVAPDRLAPAGAPA